MTALKKIGSLFAKKNFVRGGAGRNVFAARRVKKRPKRTIDINDERRHASGAHGEAFDFHIYKGWHRVKLVIKKYHFGKQTRKAEVNFELFQKLKSHGFPVPPTIRLVEIEGKKYVALTDLSKFGQIQTKSYDDVRSFFGDKKADEIMDYIRSQKKRAAKAGIILKDCWEFAIDPEKKTCRAFILDLEQCKDKSKQ